MPWTPLHDAAGYGDLDAIEELVRSGCYNIDALSVWDKTPMHVAAENGRPSAIELLFRLGSKAIDALDGSGSTPLHHAAVSGHPLVIEALVRLGSWAIDTPNRFGNTPLRVAFRNICSPSIPTVKKTLVALGATPIFGFDISPTEDEAHEIRWRVFFSESFVEKLLRLL